MRKFLVSFCVVFLAIFFACQTNPAFIGDPQYRDFESFEALSEFLRWQPGSTPLASAHRGGPMPGFPENCIETFENTLRYTPAILECDVRRTSDNVLVMMHDDTIDRTTNGRGNVSELTFAEIRALQLVDNNGKPTGFRVPTLAEVLKWADGKAILSLDIKGGIQPETIVDTIAAYAAESHVIVISYNLATAEAYFQRNPQLMISASAGDMEGFSRLVASEIPAENLVIFTGVSEPERELYDTIHSHNIRAILGTIGNLDRRANTRGIGVYTDLLRNGADILATDNLEMVATAIRKFVSE